MLNICRGFVHLFNGHFIVRLYRQAHLFFWSDKDCIILKQEPLSTAPIFSKTITANVQISTDTDGSLSLPPQAAN